MPTRTAPRTGDAAAHAVHRSVVTAECRSLHRLEAQALVERDPDRPRPAHAAVRAFAEVLGIAPNGRRTQGPDLDPVAVWREEEDGKLTGRMVLLDGRARLAAYKRANRSRVRAAPRGVPAVIYTGPREDVLRALPR